MTNFIWHTDPSHAWLEVTRKHLKALGIENKVSEYSYQFGNRVYLEEGYDVSPCRLLRLHPRRDTNNIRQPSRLTAKHWRGHGFEQS